MNADAKIFVPFSLPVPVQTNPSEMNEEQIQEMIRTKTIVPLREDDTYVYYNVINNMIVTKRWLSLEQLKSASEGYGGRIGLLPYFYDAITGKRMYMLNISNRNLYSDFGGGFKLNRSPYKGLLKELSEEAPQWADYFIERLNEITDFPPVIYFTENILSTRQQLRTDIMIVLQIDPSKLSEFVQTKEVKELKIVDDDDLFTLFNTQYDKLNNGLRLIRTIYSEMTTYL